MNRAQRRQENRLARAKPNRSRAIYSTSFTLLFESFDTIDRMIQKLRHGELEYISGVPVVMSLKGEWYAMLPALDGWIAYWRELTEQHNISYDDSPLAKLRNKLEYSMPLTLDDVDAAESVVHLQRKLYMCLPKSVTTRVAHKVQADIMAAEEIAELMKVAA
ncbi:hypothetical protein ED236_00395 [Pseudomethylobacillus aquaticus]|uniref:Uncharacterized protein n=1 Tax=Pseudomethylobacillus aquaticus TaxID=2676064 RepID=A0A3N0V5A3_9PROT|nr:hypothetical protein [Pseudomethylobacillus aquaticus]ROH87987.1 hypothetical protein ED236_00395 [Pseudomethylobacillus aquaticus]